jgi:lysophospholipase L1-like esterase
MKRILIYGDSNTWGAGPENRYPDERQWSMILQTKLGGGYRVIQEG